MKTTEHWEEKHLRGVISPSLSCPLMVLSIWFWDSATSCQAGDILPAAEILQPSESPGLTWPKLWWEQDRTSQEELCYKTQLWFTQKAMVGLDVITSSCLYLSCDGRHFSSLSLFVCLGIWCICVFMCLYHPLSLPSPHHFLNWTLSSNLEMINEFQGSSWPQC